MKTIRRDQLLKLAEAGKLIMVGSYHYDEMTGAETRNKELPVRVMHPRPDDHLSGFKEGFCNLRECDFQSHGGMAYMRDDNTVSLHVYSGRFYDFRLVDGASIKPINDAGRGRRPENQRMQAFLASNGIKATVKYIAAGSLRGCWRLADGKQPWTTGLADKLNLLGFTDFDGQPLGQHSGNGGMFCVFVLGHNELLAEPAKVEAK
ncbi:MAG: hypothetical protein KGJ13_08875 [Patescibacteria group bacterium]|nr:hypothetical protein [Patescibacteria group bacterium]